MAKEMTAEFLRALQAEIMIALGPIAEKHGVKFKPGRGTYDREGAATLKLEVGFVDEGGVVQTKEAITFLKLAHLYGMKPEYLGQTFAPGNGKAYKVIGLNQRKERQPVLLEDTSTGKQYYATTESIIRALKSRFEPQAELPVKPPTVWL